MISKILKRFRPQIYNDLEFCRNRIAFLEKESEKENSTIVAMSKKISQLKTENESQRAHIKQLQEEIKDLNEKFGKELEAGILMDSIKIIKELLNGGDAKSAAVQDKIDHRRLLQQQLRALGQTGLQQQGNSSMLNALGGLLGG